MILFSHFVDPPLPLLTSEWTTWDIALGIKFAPIGCRGLWLTDHIQMEHELCSVILTTASRVTNVRNLLQCKIYSECNPQMLSRRELWSALGKLGKLETLRSCRVLFVQIQPEPPWRPPLCSEVNVINAKNCVLLQRCTFAVSTQSTSSPAATLKKNNKSTLPEFSIICKPWQCEN